MMRVVISGAVALAVVALASAPVAAAGLQVKISGFVAFQSTLSLSDSRSDSFDRDYDFQTNARLIFDVKNVTDSGLEYGARVRFNSVNRDDGVRVTRTYVYVKGTFGTITFGNAPTIADDIGYVYAHDDLVSDMGAGALDFGELLDGDFPLGGGNFYSIDATYLAGLTNEDTRIKYLSPTFNGFSFGIDFTPVVGGAGHAGAGGVNDLINDDQTFYENVVTAGVNYEDTFGDLSVRGAATAAYGNGVQTSAAGANPHGHNLEVYTIGGKVGYQGFWASVNWTHNESIALADKSVDTIIGDLSYQSGPFLASLSYAYTWAGKHSGLNAADGDGNGQDLQDNHIVGANVTYTVAPGLNTYAEVIYEKQNFREGGDFENANLITGLILGF
ncbi:MULTISPECIES: porin [unclassified Inquilinus]|uniref:porin n=1 Tax=unclassified Inquilinus TaxID=2645927 RepID=UPI003F903F6E